MLSSMVTNWGCQTKQHTLSPLRRYITQWLCLDKVTLRRERFLMGSGGQGSKCRTGSKCSRNLKIHKLIKYRPLPVSTLLINRLPFNMIIDLNVIVMCKILSPSATVSWCSSHWRHSSTNQQPFCWVLRKGLIWGKSLYYHDRVRSLTQEHLIIAVLTLFHCLRDVACQWHQTTRILIVTLMAVNDPKQTLSIGIIGEKLMQNQIWYQCK